MMKTKKHIVLITLMLIMILVGCNRSINLNSEYEVEPNQTKNHTVNSGNASNNFKSLDELTIIYSVYKGTVYYKNTDEWTKYFSDKYDINLIVNYNTKLGNEITNIDNYVIYTAPEKFYGDGTNLFILRGKVPHTNSMKSESPYEFVNNLYELSSFYSLYNWENYVDSTLLEYFKKGNEIYFIPVLNSPRITPRYYNKQYIDIIGCDVPETIGEFYDYLTEARKMFKNDTNFYPMYTMSNKAIPVLSDIFRAFNCYTDITANTTIALNPQTNSIEDCVFSSDFEDALIYIRALQDQQLLYIVTNYLEYDENGKVIEGNELVSNINLNFATEHRYLCNIEGPTIPDGLKKENKPQYETIEGYYLSGRNTRNLLSLNQDVSFYAFPKNIKNIGGTIELFNDIFTNGDNSYDLMYGKENEDYYIYDNKLVLGDPEDYFTNLQPLNKPEVSEVNRILYNIPDSLTYRINTIFSINNFSNSSRMYNKINRHSTNTLFDTDLSVEECINKYRKDFKMLGDYEIIEELNEKLGLKGTYEY